MSIPKRIKVLEEKAKPKVPPVLVRFGCPDAEGTCIHRKTCDRVADKLTFKPGERPEIIFSINLCDEQEPYPDDL